MSTIKIHQVVFYLFVFVKRGQRNVEMLLNFKQEIDGRRLSSFQDIVQMLLRNPQIAGRRRHGSLYPLGDNISLNFSLRRFHNVNTMCPLIEYHKTPNKIQEKSILVVDMRETLSQLLTRKAHELGISKSEVARRTGLSRQYIGNIFNRTAPTKSGQYILSPETVGKLAKALALSENEILSSMDYLTSDGSPKPKNIGEFLQILESWGLQFGPTMADMDALENYTADDFEELLERIRRDVISDIEITKRRRRR